MMSDSANQIEQPQQAARSIMTIAMWAIALGVLALLGWGLVDSNTPRPEVGEPAPGFDLEFFEDYGWQGKTAASLDDMKGQIVIVNFWASWCIPCRTEVPELEQAWQKYRDQGVVFIGVAYADVEPKSIAFMEEFNVTFPNAPDLGTLISRDYEITAVPETFIIDRNGDIAYVQPGPINIGTLDAVITQLLAKENN